jgi:hypothetical protein
VELLDPSGRNFSIKEGRMIDTVMNGQKRISNVAHVTLREMHPDLQSASRSGDE